MTRWYRAYAGTVKDDKLAEAAIVAGCSRSIAIAAWHAILESAAETADGGRFETTPRRIAAILGEPAATIEAVISAMAEIGMIESGAVVAWKARQFESDSSTERSRRHRNAKRNGEAPACNGDATLQGRSATPPDTETETDTSVAIAPDVARTAPRMPVARQCHAALSKVLDDQHAAAVIEHRNRLRKPMTVHAAELLAGSLAKSADPNAAADEMIERGWQSWKPGWGGQAHAPPGRPVRRNSALEGLDELEHRFSDAPRYPRLAG